MYYVGKSESRIFVNEWISNINSYLVLGYILLSTIQKAWKNIEKKILKIMQNESNSIAKTRSVIDKHNTCYA